ncbi:hypothetical protein [Hwanghaeella sp.]|uniref:hypothetical protein n=1 Tax=Hwanghaeella sp. TaxID=2605943 RepID=UPI003CCB9269
MKRILENGSRLQVNRRQVLLGTSAVAFSQLVALPACGATGISVFDQPIIIQAHVHAAVQLQRKKYKEAAGILQELAKRFPEHGDTQFLQAVTAFRLLDFGKGRSFVEAAIRNGFGNPDQLRTEDAFRSVRKRPWFVEAVMAAEENALSASTNRNLEIVPTPIIAGEQAEVTERNTTWDPSTGLLLVNFSGPSQPPPGEVLGQTIPVHKRVNDLYAAGQVAGNGGDVYLNLDRGHSMQVRQSLFKQFATVTFPDSAKKNQLDYSFNLFWFINRPTLGNASLGANGRSLARMGLSSTLGLRNVYRQYRGNQLFIYPAVNDHLPEKEDKFPFNVPYLFVSQGRSGSDGNFIRASATALASFSPRVKQFLTQKGLLMPTVQQILRHSLIPADNPAAYLTSEAHSVAIDGKKLDLDRVVTMASEMRIESVPPLVDLTLVGRPSGATSAFATPNAIGVVVKGKRGASVSMSVAATITENTVPAEPDLDVVWTVIQGDKNKISIENVGSTRRANIQVSWHDQFFDPAMPDIATRRVDIGVFARRGNLFSAPSFISVAFEGLV